MKKERELIWKLIDRTISGAEFEQLQNALLESAELRQVYQRQLETEEALRKLPLRVPADREEKSKWPWRKVGAYLAAGAAMAACLVFLFHRPLVDPDAGPGADPVVGKNYRFTPRKGAVEQEQRNALASEIRERALLTASITAVGGGQGAPQVLPVALPGGLLEVLEGWVELTFEESAVVRLEAPASFEIISTSSGYLYRGNVLVSDDGGGDPFSLFYGQGKVVDVGTEFAMRIEPDEDYHIFVTEGAVDHYNGAVLELARLEEGDLLAGGGAKEVVVEHGKEVPGWVPRRSQVRFEEWKASTLGPIKIQTATWLRGAMGSGRASGSLSGIGVTVTSDACHNAGEIHPMRWVNYLGGLEPAAAWYHAECASIGVRTTKNGGTGASPVKVEFQGEVRDPILLFGWGEGHLQIDLRFHEIRREAVWSSHPSIRLEEGIVDFGQDPNRQNIEGQVIAVRINGTFGPRRPLIFDLLSSKAKDATLSFSLGLPGK